MPIRLIDLEWSTVFIDNSSLISRVEHYSHSVKSKIQEDKPCFGMLPSLLN